MFRRDGPTRCHTAHTTPLNYRWSEAPTGPPGDIIAASLVQLRQVGGRGRALVMVVVVVIGVVRYCVTDRGRREEREEGKERNQPADATGGGTAGAMAATWRKLCGHVLLLLATCRHSSASE